MVLTTLGVFPPPKTPRVGLLMGGGLGTGNSGQTDISYLTIATLGNEREFGDLRTGYEDIAATSGSHGGLQ